jgi:hypothetical protein
MQYMHEVEGIDGELYDRWRVWEEQRMQLAHRLLRETLGDLCPPRPALLCFEDWVSTGRPGEARIRAALQAFGGVTFKRTRPM